MGLNGDLCCRCGLEAEDTNHLFIKCLVARCIWWQLSVWMRISIPTDSHSVTERLAFFTNQLGSKRWKKVVLAVVMAAFWRIWICRNDKLFNGKEVPYNRMVEAIKEDAFVWIKYRSSKASLEWDSWVSFNVGTLL
ncbi:hypothetical protein HanXRQr2_Chr06g0269351 [Helianthus annuus]|uniref:Reverse transcriptase zinc-binding domain-containing protein n=1 Tax=Helianthus annuus TaxID=4232 RepID=A0A9K3NJV2_HELAN|nr:hypothetical protein HanXRQr2_Chr06g0269351 [Helianthus annuus]KAJ0567864.1 hypothetical protein HanIR_Chr06g0289681 [Helianthus annuus]KAJ0574310.1 hypothetical protein HanHA89_Chr06g0236691 [Helianthus annuus]KAJ0738646.1 hypothetical protein HanLR1_Chr06g0220631 [Helianthus annuus]KAJ0741530.1 hypothetical protein HanOQP8_Chr06g0229091 [Helianthus annuus]